MTAGTGPSTFITELSNGNALHCPGAAIRCHIAKCLFSQMFLLMTVDTVIAVRPLHFYVPIFKLETCC